MREVAATYYFRCRRAPTETTNKWRQKVRQWLRTIWINHRLGVLSDRLAEFTK